MYDNIHRQRKRLNRWFDHDLDVNLLVLNISLLSACLGNKIKDTLTRLHAIYAMDNRSETSNALG
jgi:hypothetical protein